MTDGYPHVGLLVPGVFFGLNDEASLAALRELARIGGSGDPRGPWFLADNLITYGHTRGFLVEPRFVSAGTSGPSGADRTCHRMAYPHTLLGGRECFEAVRRLRRVRHLSGLLG